jgi:predicted PurR-regulated permease PerM
MSTWRPPLWYDRLAGIAWRAVIVTIAVTLLVTGMLALSSVILPAVLGLLFACGLHPLTELLHRRGLPRGASSALCVLALITAVAAVAWLTVRVVVDQWDGIEVLLESGRATLEDGASDTGVDESTAAEIGDDIGSLVTDVAGLLVGGIIRLVPTAAGIVATILLSFLVAFFFLKDGALMWRWILARLGETAVLTDRIGRRTWKTLSGFIIGQTVIALVDASLITLGAIALGVPEPAAIFMVTFFGAYVPYIGAFLSGLLAVLLAIGDSGIATGAVMFVIVIVVQIVEGNVLQPWIQGRAVDLHPLVIAFAVTAGGALAGFLGVFLAVPVTAAGFVMLSELRKAGIVGPMPGAAIDAGTGQPDQ